MACGVDRSGTPDAVLPYPLAWLQPTTVPLAVLRAAGPRGRAQAWPRVQLRASSDKFWRAVVAHATMEATDSDSLRVDVLAFLHAAAPDTDAHATAAGHKRPRSLDHDEALLRAEPEPRDEEALAHLLVGVEASATFEAASTGAALHTLLERVHSMHERCELHAGKLVSACEVEATRRGLDAPLLVAWSLHESGLVPLRTWLERSRASWTGSLRKLHERAEALLPDHDSLDMAILDAICLQLVAGMVEEAATSQTRQRCEDALHAFCAEGDGQTAPSLVRLSQVLHTASRLGTMGGVASGGAARVASALLRSRLRGAVPVRTRGGGWARPRPRAVRPPSRDARRRCTPSWARASWASC